MMSYLLLRGRNGQGQRFTSIYVSTSNRFWLGSAGAATTIQVGPLFALTTTTAAVNRQIHRGLVTHVSLFVKEYNNKNGNNNLRPFCQSSLSHMQLCYRYIFTFSSSSSSSSSGPNRWSLFWKRFAWMVRTLRIPILVFSVYKLGYQQGIIECTKHPETLQQQILQALVAGHRLEVGDATTTRTTRTLPNKNVEILSERDISYLNPHPHHQVATVGHRIVSAARGYVQEQLELAIQNVLVKLPDDITPEQAQEYLLKDDEFEFWYHAALRLMGEVNTFQLTASLSANSAEHLLETRQNNHADMGKNKNSSLPAANQKQKQQAPPTSRKKLATTLKHVPWQYVFVESPDPNAFVSEILPQKIFITTGMLELATTPDELALVLGHEISHLILGHVSQSAQVETLLRTLEVTLLSLDPTSGLLSLGVIWMLATLRSALTAAHSRENEREADDLGICLTARACYNTETGAHVMYKMHQAKVAMAPESITVGGGGNNNDDASAANRVQLLDTHPPTLERYERLLQQAKDGENYTKYKDEQCATMSSRIYAALGWSAGGGGSSSSSKKS